MKSGMSCHLATWTVVVLDCRVRVSCYLAADHHCRCQCYRQCRSWNND